MDRNEEAIECYNKTLELFPGSTAIWSNKGIALSYDGKYSEALTCFNETIERNPENEYYQALAWFNKGLVFLLLKKPEEGIFCFNKSIEIDEESEFSWNVWFSKGIALKSLDRRAEADRAAAQKKTGSQ